MPKYFSEKKATIRFKGKSFTSGGAYHVPAVHKKTGKKIDLIFAYLGKNKHGSPVVTNWKGKPISEKVRITSESRLNRYGEKKFGVRFKVGKKVFSGMNYGGFGAYLKARSTKLKSIY